MSEFANSIAHEEVPVPNRLTVFNNLLVEINSALILLAPIL